MKTGLVAALAAAILLLGSLIYWRTRPSESAAPEIRAPEGSVAPGSPSELSTEASGPERSADAPLVPEDARSAAAPLSIPPPALEDDLASPEIDGSEIHVPAPTSIDEVQRAGDETFEKRYQGTSSADRSAAIGAIKTVLASHRDGDLEKGQSLTDEQVADLERELEWLAIHP